VPNPEKNKKPTEAPPASDTLRLQKYLAECGVASRRASEALIEAGRITVNGKTAELGVRVDPTKDEILFDGATVASEKKLYILLNKPAGVLSTVKDTHGRKTVLHCLKEVQGRVFPVGRLDQDVEGVLLLTNDGELAHRLMHPSYEVRKVYRVWVEGRVTRAALSRLENGVELEDGRTAPAEVEVLRAEQGCSQIRLTLHEGRKREVKRMCDAVGHSVQSLKREAFAGLRARNLPVGEWRPLSPPEIARLRKITKC
jgi:23S rRNA pseudouridine2605 synthase